MATKKAAGRKTAAGKGTAARKSQKPGPKPVAKAKLDALGIDWVCEQIVEKVTMTAIAAKAKVSIGTLISWLEDIPERSARAREARSSVAKLYDDEAYELIGRAKNAFELAKAREQAQHLRWRAAKIAPTEYGEKLALGGASDLPPLVMVKDMTGRKD